MTHEKQERRYRYGPGAPCVDEIERDAKAKQERIQGQGGATPGPWRSGMMSGGRGYEVCRDDGVAGYMVAELPFRVGISAALREADAKLIAASPELADALQFFVAFHSGHVLPVDLGAAMTAARAALRKAGLE